ncbi:conserved hypothetical protein [Leishmania major strain Friedlin]|uniref:Uncharacterized protein n=1 Tax=Leishmania major TaxID=5664 RepID=Q4QIK4_LEIMA|nr:conserved hypothetical protein [Leishmania major strain Friedlin]CAJ07049.1 conserved hypothetical protein [Leishmania major strain Friedlin]|eukprot:XP_001680994.1 conserved hypothetical protein [Leishmania major strain Friedlin]
MEGRTSARCALVCMTSAALALALLIPAACGFVGAAAAAPMTVTTTPSLPLLDVPFHADVAGIGKGHSLFVSSQSDCSAASKVTSVCTLGSAVDGVSFANGTCVFHVTSEALGVDLTRPRPTVPALYWCSSARPGASVGALQMNVVSTVPLFFYRAEYNELTFSDATPLGSVIRWSSNPDCGSPLPNHANAVLGSSRVVPLKYSGDTVYVCATIPTVSGAMTALEHRATVIGTYLYRISPTSGVRHRTISMTTTITESIAMISVSHDPYCRTLEQPGKFYASLTSFDFVWSVAAGVYYLCVITNKDVGLPSSNSFTVEEYDVQPHTMYVARETPLTYGLSAAGRDAELETALATTTDCIGGSLVVPWGASMSWAVAKVGTYYACVRDRGAASTAGYTSAITVTDVPTLTFSPSPAVLGVPVSATVSHALSRKNVFRVRVSKGGTCDSEGATGATPRGSATATVRMPLGMPASVTYCVSNPLGDGEDGADTPVGGAVYYALGALRTRAYRVGHGALLTNMRMTMRLDSEVLLPRGTSVVLAPSARVSGTCPGAMAAADAAGADESMAFDVSGASAILSPVVFASPGAWLVCVRDGAGGDAGYTQAAQLQVYSDAAALSTDTVLNGVRTEVVVSRLPPEAPVTVTSSSTCGLSMESVGAGTTNSDGVVTLNVQSASAGPLLVCAGYPTASESSATDVGIEYAPAGTVRSANARVYPSIAYVSETTTLSFAGIGGMSLTGYFAFFLPHATSCSEPDATVLGSGLKGPDATSTVSYGTVSGSALERGTVYRVCVGRSIDDGYCDAGVVAAMEVPSVSTDPPVPVRGLPVRLQLPPSFTSTAAVTFYVVVGDTARCSGDLSETRVYGSGSVDRTSGATAAFVAPARASGVDAVRVCVGSNESLVSDSLGYTHGATLRLEQFHTSMVYLQRGVPNVLSGAPMAATGSLYVVACDGKECAADNADGVCRAKMSQGATSSATAALNAPLGRYFLCQRVTVGTVVSVVGSNTTVEVVEPFKMHLSVDPSAIRAYVPFAVTMSGGPGGAGAKYTVVAQPASTPCGETAAESQRFVTGRDTTDITITDIVPVQNIRFCVQPSPADSFEVLTGTLQHYMTPAAVIGDRATTLTSGGVRRGATAVLSRTADCLGVVAGGGAAPIVDARVTFTVTSCGANGALASLYYCEAASGGAYASRGAVGLLRASGCSGGADASIAEVDAAPGAAIGSFGIDTAYLARPRLSASPDCDVLLDAAVASVGYAPGADERAAFHVCAVLAGDASVTFTTARPTLRVANWAVSPTAAVSRYNATLGAAAATAVRVNYATPSSETFLSTASDCSVRTASAAGLSGASRSATYSTTGVRGLVYVCTVAPLSGKTLAVAQFLSVTPPAVLRVSPAVVRGGEYSATLVVDGAPPLYSMVPGADSGYTHSGYYTSASREVYLSGDACSGVLAGTSAATVSSSGSVSLATAGVAAGVSSVWLCAVTAAGPAVVLAGVAVAPGRVHPTTMVSGALGAPVFIPSLKGTAVQLSASASGCGSVAGMPSFTTDAEGYGAVDLVGGDGGALAPGTYTLCYGGAPRGGGGGAAALESVELVRASYFDVRGTTFVVGVAGRMPLLQDLTAEALVPGFSTARDCTSVSSEHGEWAAVTSTSVSVTATSVYTAGLYLCARAPVNGTLVALPGQWSEARSVQFVASAMQLPSAGWDACTTYTLGQCYPPGASASGATSVVAVVHGDCCSESSRSAVVGEASMASGTCELTLDYDKVSAYPAGSTYHVCVWDSADDSVCTTVSEARVSTNCTRGGRGLSRGTRIAIIVVCVVLGTAFLCLLFWTVWWCCCRRQLAEGANWKPEKGRQLVGFQELGDEDRLVGYVMSGRHPLLYYPSSSARIGRSVSASLGYPSMSGSGCGALEAVEDEGRDQIALQEARARYNLRLTFAERLQLLELAEKNAAADAAGMNTTYASGDSYLHGVAQPERRCVESILTEGGPRESEMDFPVRAAAPRHAGAKELELAAFEVPEEGDISLSADANVSLEMDPITGEYQKVRSRSIESAPRRCLSPVESCWTNEDFEEREEEESYRKVAVEAAIPDSELSVRMWPRQAGGDHEEPQRVAVRHFAKPTSFKSRRSASLNRSGSGGHRRGPTGSASDDRKQQPHYDPLAVMPVTPKALSTSKGLTNYILSPPDGENDSPPDLRTNTAHEVGDTTTAESAIFSRSPIAHAGTHDMSEEALPVGMARVRSSEAIAGKVNSDESEDDLLSFTTTQRFYDEKRFLREQEDGRRQRLCNWEEEERAQLAQDELNGYMALSSATGAGGDTVNASSYHSENSDTEYNAGGSLGKGHYGKTTAKHEGEDEQVSHIPAAPTTLPSLPPAPRPQTLQNDYYYVVPTGDTGAS